MRATMRHRDGAPPIVLPGDGARRAAAPRTSESQTSSPRPWPVACAPPTFRPMRTPPLPFAALALCSCVRNPATGKLQLDLLSRVAGGGDGKAGEGGGGADVRDLQGEAGAEPVRRGRSASSSRRRADGPSLPWSYEIVDDASVNAFALPGGPVFITRGILGHLNTEAEMAAVLGHETGHVAARHSANQMSKQQVAQLGLGVGSDPLAGGRVRRADRRSRTAAALPQVLARRRDPGGRARVPLHDAGRVRPDADDPALPDAGRGLERGRGGEDAGMAADAPGSRQPAFGDAAAAEDGAEGLDRRG